MCFSPEQVEGESRRGNKNMLLCQCFSWNSLDTCADMFALCPSVCPCVCACIHVLQESFQAQNVSALLSGMSPANLTVNHKGYVDRFTTQGHWVKDQDCMLWKGMLWNVCTARLRVFHWPWHWTSKPASINWVLKDKVLKVNKIKCRP